MALVMREAASYLQLQAYLMLAEWLVGAANATVQMAGTLLVVVALAVQCNGAVDTAVQLAMVLAQRKAVSGIAKRMHMMLPTNVMGAMEATMQRTTAMVLGKDHGCLQAPASGRINVPRPWVSLGFRWESMEWAKPGHGARGGTICLGMPLGLRENALCLPHLP